MIYSVKEIKNLIPSLVNAGDDKVTFLLQSAEMEICSILRVKKLPKYDEMPMQIKTACVWLIEHSQSEEKTAGMKSFRQWNISVDYGDENAKKDILNINLKKLLAPLTKVKVWS